MAGLGVKEDVGPLLLEQLPCEIIICILSFLVWRDVIKCCSVSSTLRMCARDNVLWKRLYLHRFPSSRPNEDETMAVGHWQQAVSVRYSCHKHWLTGQKVPDHSYTLGCGMTNTALLET
jgi:hypothetical protein